MTLCKDCGLEPRTINSKTGKKYSYCKSCSSKRVYESQKKNHETFKKNYKKYRNSKKGKEAITRANKKYIDNNRELVREKLRNANRLKNGFTPELFNSMLKKQNYKCALCFKDINQSSHADHNHLTGKARGVLCHFCNTTLGKIEKLGFDWVDRAREYIKD